MIARARTFGSLALPSCNAHHSPREMVERPWPETQHFQAGAADGRMQNGQSGQLINPKTASVKLAMAFRQNQSNIAAMRQQPGGAAAGGPQAGMPPPPVPRPPAGAPGTGGPRGMGQLAMAA